FRSRVPAKMTSSMREPRKVLADCSPSTQAMASAMLDLPQPFGPTMAAMPSPKNFTSVRSQNDLNPSSSSFLRLSNLSPQGVRCARLRTGRSATVATDLVDGQAQKPNILWILRPGPAQSYLQYGHSNNSLTSG